MRVTSYIMPDDSALILARHILGFMCLFKNKLAAKTSCKGLHHPPDGILPYYFWGRTNRYKTKPSSNRNNYALYKHHC